MTQGDRLPFGEDVVDRMLRGGIPENRPVLIRGGAGTGKTTLAMQWLQAGLDAGERCLFVSTEQTRGELRDSFSDYEFDLDHEELALTTLHPSPRGSDAKGGELSLRTLEGGSVIDDRDIPFTIENLARYFERARSCDRLVLDSVSALKAVTESKELFRRQLLELIRVFSDQLEATTLFTAERMGGDDPLSFTTHGVISLRRERIKDDPHRFLEIEKMRGIDHDRRTVEYTFESHGIDAGPSRRSQPPELKTHKHTSIGIDGLDSLCGGGLATGAGVLLEHDGHANLSALFGALLSRAVEREATLVLVPTIRMRPDSVRTILEGYDISLSGLLDDDRLFVIDMIGAWDDDRENVFAGCDSADEVALAYRSIADEADDGPRFTLVNADAMVNRLGADGARRTRYTLESDWLRPEDLLVHIHNPNVTSDDMHGFYTNAAEQILQMWVTDTGLQYVALQKSPCGFVGITSLVEYITEPPYLKVQEPPEERENPYAE